MSERRPPTWCDDDEDRTVDDHDPAPLALIEDAGHDCGRYRDAEADTAGDVAVQR